MQRGRPSTCIGKRVVPSCVMVTDEAWQRRCADPLTSCVHADTCRRSQAHSEASIGKQRQSRGNQEAIRHPRRESEAIIGNRRPSEAIRGHQRHQRPSEAQTPFMIRQSKAITCASPSCSTPLMATTSSSRSSIEALTNPDETSSRSSVKCHDASLKLFVRDRIPPAAPPELPPARSLPQALPVLPLRTCLDVDAPPPPPPLPPLLPLPLLLLLLLLLHPNG